MERGLCNNYGHIFAPTEFKPGHNPSLYVLSLLFPMRVTSAKVMKGQPGKPCLT